MTFRHFPLSDIHTIAIVGLGLIGGSVARGLRHCEFEGSLIGIVENESDRAQALELGLVDHCHTAISENIAHADLIVVAVPPGAMPVVLTEIATHRHGDAIVTDTASSKTGVIAAAQQAFDSDALARFVPGHPIAGTENNGLDAGFATLFQKRRTILTPTPDTLDDALSCVAALWRELGADVITMTAEKHDDVLAATSHLPHVLAYTLVDTLVGMNESADLFSCAAGGFADFTRIASSNPALWRDIISANRRPVLRMIDEFMAHLTQVRDAIELKDDIHLEACFARAKAARDDFIRSQQTKEDS